MYAYKQFMEMKKINLFLVIFLLYKNICYSNFMSAKKAVFTIKLFLYLLIPKRFILLNYALKRLFNMDQKRLMKLKFYQKMTLI